MSKLGKALPPVLMAAAIIVAFGADDVPDSLVFAGPPVTSPVNRGQ
jgi:hypothetical protein